MKSTMTLAFLMLLVSGCESVGPLTTSQVCAGWKPIEGQAEDVDVISDRLAVSIAAHEAYGERLGCW